MTAANDPYLRWVTTRAMALGVVVVAASLLLGSAPVTLGAGVGAVLALANFWALRRLVAGMLRNSTKGRALATLLLTLKLGVLAGVLFLLMRYVPMDAPALLVGISVVVAVIVAGTVLGPSIEPEDAD